MVPYWPTQVFHPICPHQISSVGEFRCTIAIMQEKQQNVLFEIECRICIIEQCYKDSIQYQGCKFVDKCQLESSYHHVSVSVAQDRTGQYFTQRGKKRSGENHSDNIHFQLFILERINIKMLFQTSRCMSILTSSANCFL